MPSINSILISEPEPPRLTSMLRAEYVTCTGMNPSSLAAGLVGVADVNPAAIKLAWETPDAAPRTMTQQDSLDRGTLAHLMILQPELLLDRVAQWTGGRRASNEYDEFKAANEGKLVIKSTDYQEVAVATNVMRTEPKVAELFHGGEYEIAMFGSEPSRIGKGHIAVKGQVDCVNRAKKTIVDLKTTAAGISQREVERTIRYFHYREKMAAYRRWVARATESEPEAWQCYNVFMSLTPPCGVQIVKFTNDSLEWAEERMLFAMAAVDECLHNETWPLYLREMFMGMAKWEIADGEDVIYG